MNRAVLLRFHKDPQLVQNRIELLRYFNPNLPIYGLYGGIPEEFESFANQLTGLDHIATLDITDPNIKWRFSDFSILSWFEQHGKFLPFDVLHISEYDLVMLESMEKIYPYFPDQQPPVYLTGLKPLAEVKVRSNWFTNQDFPVAECLELEQLFKNKYGLKNLLGSKSPGSTLTKEFLMGYAQLDLPLIGFDEMRQPAIAQILGIEIKDTGFCREFWDEPDNPDFHLFNTDNVEIKLETMITAYQTGQQLAFHPVYYPVDPQQF